MPERGRLAEIRRIFESALALPKDERDAYLDVHCPVASARAEVRTLLDIEEEGEAEAFLDGLAARAGAGMRGEEAPGAPDVAMAGSDGADGDPAGALGERIRTFLGDDYADLAAVGRGGMGLVYRARHGPLDRLVAIKVLDPSLRGDREARARFEQEARSAAALSHPNVVPIYTVDALGDGLPFITMRFVEGGSLREWIEEHSPAEPSRALGIMRQVASALEAAHRRGIVHRDVKPGNILIDPQGAGDGLADRVLLTDFGIAKAAGARDAALTVLGSMVGSPRYMSPEQAAGDDLDARSDVYSLGVVAYELVAGHTPFDADSMQRMIVCHLTEPPPPLADAVRGCPDAVAELVHRCLEKDPARRYSSAAELAGAIDALVGSRPSSRAPVRRPEGSGPVLRARGALLLAIVASVAALLLDRYLLGGYTLSALVVVGAATVGAETARRLWLGGFAFHQLLLPKPGRPRYQPVDVQPLAEERAEAIRRGRADRALILRTFHHLHRVEQAELPKLRPITDRLLREITKAARELDVLDRTLGANGTSEGAGAIGERRRAEMGEARARLESRLSSGLSTISELRHTLDRYAARGGAVGVESVLDFMERIDHPAFEGW